MVNGKQKWSIRGGREADSTVDTDGGLACWRPGSLTKAGLGLVDPLCAWRLHLQAAPPVGRPHDVGGLARDQSCRNLHTQGGKQTLKLQLRSVARDLSEQPALTTSAHVRVFWLGCL